MKQLLRFLASRGSVASPDLAQALAAPGAPAPDAVVAALSRVGELPFVVTRDDLARAGVALPGLPAPTQAPPVATAPKTPVQQSAPFLRHSPIAEPLVQPRLVAPAVAATGASVMLEPPRAVAPPASVQLVAAKPQLKDQPPYAHQWEVLADVTGQSTCEGEIQDFAKYFNDRLAKLKKLLRQRREMAGHIPIKSIRPGGQAEVKIIGIVTEARETKNGHRLLEIEDETGTVAVLAPASDHALLDEASLSIEDEVVGVIAKPATRGELLILQRIVRPDVPLARDPHRSASSSAVAFISDIHFGSKTFLQDDWDRFVRWINGDYGDSQQRALAKKTKYLVVAGDVVDGIGIFPGQEDELAIDDGGEQYRHAGEEFSRIERPDLKIFMSPGNHDLVRPAEPQPAFPDKYRGTFPSNVTFLGNPVKLTIEGVEILSYHGLSFVDWIKRIPGLTWEDPIRAMKEMLVRRHVAPLYGAGTPIAPEHRDLLVIDTVPDIFETGHVHAAGMETYRGIELINSGCWQSQTAYQKMHGFQPNPGKVPVVELDSGAAWFLDFHGGKPVGVDAASHGRATFVDSFKDKTKGGGEWSS